MYEVEYYTTRSGRCPVQDFFDKLAKNRSRIADVSAFRIQVDLLQEHGLDINKFAPNAMKKIRDDIYELRPRGNRVFFLAHCNERFVLLHAYKKQSDKAPAREINKAIQEKNDYLGRCNNGK